MKKRYIFIIIGILIVGAGIPIYLYLNNKYSKIDLNIYNWEDYLGENTIKNFEDEFDMKVNLKTFEDEDIAFEELYSKSGEYDLVIISDILVRKGIEKELFEKINKTNIKNLNEEKIKLLHQRKIISTDYDLKIEYSIPYLFGTTGIIINTDKIDKKANSLEILWDKNYSGKISLLNNVEEVFSMALKYMGKSINTNEILDLMQAKEFLEIQKTLIVGYEDQETIKEKMKSEEIWIGQIYEDGGKLLEGTDSKFKYIFPKEGGVQWVDNFVIPKNAKNKKNAELFINYILRPEVSKEIYEYQGVVVFNYLESLNPEYLENIQNFEFLNQSTNKKIEDFKFSTWKSLNEGFS
jgi:spermidine/putrescine transport system substrate-binding protein